MKKEKLLESLQFQLELVQNAIIRNHIKQSELAAIHDNMTDFMGVIDLLPMSNIDNLLDRKWKLQDQRRKLLEK